MENRMNTKSALLSLLMGSIIVGSPLSYAQSSSKKTRDIVLSDQIAEAPLNINIHTSKNTYKVDEPILLQADSTQDFYLYVFNTGRDGNTTMLVPNAKYSNNFFKANTIHNIPDNIGPSMVGDQAGKESLIIVASASPLTFETGFASKGVYRQAKTKDVKKMFRGKDIKWVERVSEYAPNNNTPSTVMTAAAVNTTVSSSVETSAITTTAISQDTSTITTSETSNTITNVNTTTETSPIASTTNNTEQTTSTTSSDNSNAMVTNNTTTSVDTSMPSNSMNANSASGSMISAPSLSDNKKVVSYLLEVEIVN